MSCGMDGSVESTEHPENISLKQPSASFVTPDRSISLASARVMHPVNMPAKHESAKISGESDGTEDKRTHPSNMPS